MLRTAARGLADERNGMNELMDSLSPHRPTRPKTSSPRLTPHRPESNDLIKDGAVRVAMLGLQSTGKTTYAVGAYAGMRSGKYSSLRLVKVTHGVATLNAGLERLSRRLPVSRTHSGETETIGLRVKTATSASTRCEFPTAPARRCAGLSNSSQTGPGGATRRAARSGEGLLLSPRPGEIRPGEGVAELAARSRRPRMPIPRRRGKSVGCHK